jgi:pyruvate-formate lyase-activating enzyme
MNHQLDSVQQQLPAQKPKNFCAAPFVSTMQTTYGKTSPCSYGITEWQFEHLTPKQRWESDELNKFRTEFATGSYPVPCTKCFNEEAAGKQSLRLRMDDWYENVYDNFVLTGDWQQGPKHISSKVSNVCNLSCRSCGGWDSNSFAKEGRYYIDKYDTKVLNPATNKLVNYNKFVPRLSARHTDYSRFDEIDANLTKLEFYGGEPLLNLTHLDFLEHLVSTGRNRDITLFYSTNCTQAVNPRHRRIWNQFKKIEFSLSIDHTHDKFHYLRWPGDWTEAERNIREILDLKNQLDAEVTHVMSPCCTMLNAYYLDEVVAWGQENVGSVYLNMVANPEWLAINTAPEPVKQAMLEHIQIPEVRGFLQIKPHNPYFWKQFLIWTKRQDEYRKQDFTKTFPEFYSIIKPYWDSVTDLSEENFYKE